MLSKKTKKKVLAFLAQSLAPKLLYLIYLTCKKNFFGDKLPQESCLLVTWHGEMLMMAFCYNKVKQTNKKVSVIASTHGDGQLMGNILIELTKGKIINGSSSKKALKALLEAMKDIKSGHYNVAIAPDGPRGPRHSVAGGVVTLSQKTHTPIVTFNCKASSVWQLKSWDKMFLPKPFCRLDFYIGEPFLLDELSIEEGKQKVQERLMLNASR